MGFIPFEVQRPPFSLEDYPMYTASLKMPDGDVLTVVGNALQIGPGVKDTIRRYLRSKHKNEAKK